MIVNFKAIEYSNIYPLDTILISDASPYEPTGTWQLLNKNGKVIEEKKF